MDFANRLHSANWLQNVSLASVAGWTVGGVGLIGFYRLARRDYLMYMSYGPGGLPYNVSGWLVATGLRALATDVFSTRLYDEATDKMAWLPPDWPAKPREGPRPTLGSHPLPQRQLSQLSTKEMHKELEAAFDDVVKANKDLIEFRPSLHEGHTNAIFLKSNLPRSPIVDEMLGELSHIHATGDNSVHVVLAPRDCKKVIESGWGQRHPLDGVGFTRFIFGWTIPKQYVLLYAPRNREELGVVMEIVRACIGYMANSRDVK